jgi:hypothetical protein
VGILKKGAKNLVCFMHGASPLYHLACSHARQQLPSVTAVTVVPPAVKISPDDYKFVFPPKISCLLSDAAIEKYRLDNNIRDSQNSSISHTFTRICLAMNIYSQIMSELKRQFLPDIFAKFLENIPIILLCILYITQGLFTNVQTRYMSC